MSDNVAQTAKPCESNQHGKIPLNCITDLLQLGTDLVKHSTGLEVCCSSTGGVGTNCIVPRVNHDGRSG